MRYSVRETDLVARLGADEFVIMLLPTQQTLDEAAVHADTVAEKILSSSSAPVPLPQDVHRVTASFGVTLFSGTSWSVESVLMKADAAMYQAKFAGRNTLRFYDPEMQASMNARLKIECELTSALSQDQFVLTINRKSIWRGQLPEPKPWSTGSTQTGGYFFRLNSSALQRRQDKLWKLETGFVYRLRGTRGLANASGNCTSVALG